MEKTTTQSVYLIGMNSLNLEGYPSYRRRHGITALIRGASLDNKHVVSYSPYLLLKINAHMNIEACTSLKAI